MTGRLWALAGSLALLVGARAPEPAPDAFRAMKLSTEIARIGEARADPLLLLAAARLRRGANETLATGTPDRAAEWLARAEELGASDPRVASMAADIRAEARKGRAAGPRVSHAMLRPGGQMRFAETFRAGVPAVVYVEGDGDTDLTLTVGAACRDISPGDIKICTWTPRGDGRVTVQVGNTGRIQNRVILGMN